MERFLRNRGRMKNNDLYIKLKNYALDNNLTIAEVQETTSAKIVNIVGQNNLPAAFIRNMKHRIINKLRRRKNQNNAIAIGVAVKNSLGSTLKNLDFEQGGNIKNPFTIVWHEGKP